MYLLHYTFYTWGHLFHPAILTEERKGGGPLQTKTGNYHVKGSYYEACNCYAICPCRRQNGVAHGLSTHGNCDFILSWAISEGQFEDIDLSGLFVCMAGTYDDDEDGSPWSIFIYIDERASDPQMQALSDIYQGEAKGNILFTSNISTILGIKRARIELDHRARHETIRIGNIGAVQVDRIVDTPYHPRRCFGDYARALKSSSSAAMRSLSDWSMMRLARRVAATRSRPRMRCLTRGRDIAAIDRSRMPRPSSSAV